jgi:tRNA dimethylallyltransferase
VVFCGGTGLYLDSVIGISAFSDAGIDENFRLEMSKKTPAELHAELEKIDPVSAAATHENNVKRVIRALEIFHLTGKTKSEWDEESKKQKPPYESVVIGLDFENRQALYDRINARVDMMLDVGLLDEVRSLDCPEFRSSVASDGIGYKEILKHLDGENSLDEAIEEIKKASRNYAKRQLTWFRRNKSVKWLFPDRAEGEDKFKFIVNSAINIINNN